MKSLMEQLSEHDVINSLKKQLEKAKKEIESLNKTIKAEFDKREALDDQLENANKLVSGLEKRLEQDMFWNSDGDMSFDSLEELFDYYGDCHEGGELVMDCRIAASLPDKTYRGVYDSENNEWVITEQPRKASGDDC